MKRSYWDWQDQVDSNKLGSFPYTPATNLLYGLKEAIKMLHEEGLENVLNVMIDMLRQPELQFKLGV